MPQAPPTFNCVPCKKTFGSLPALANHNTAKGHFRCQPCKRAFGSSVALEQHQTSSAHAAAAAAARATITPLPTTAAPSPPVSLLPSVFVTPSPPALLALSPPASQAPSPPASLLPSPPASILPTPLVSPLPSALPAITHRGNTYTSLPASSLPALYPLLLSHCHTPTRLALEHYALLPTPAAPHSAPPHDPSRRLRPRPRAIVLDCEMAGVAGHPDEVISLSVIDFFTGAVLVDSLVQPDRRVTQWRTWVTGITPGKMAAAVRRGEAIKGRRGAVGRLWECMDEETVLVGQAVRNDLRALGVVHTKVVDAGVMVAEASGCFGGGHWGEERRVGSGVGLKRMVEELAGIRIREGEGGLGGKAKKAAKVHDALEDVLATREVVLWCLLHPAEMREWAVKNFKPRAEAKAKVRGARRGNLDRETGSVSLSTVEVVPSTSGSSGLDEDDTEDESDRPRWEDEIDSDTWPNSPPDWSD